MRRLYSFLVLAPLAAGCVSSGDETVIILQNQVPGSGCVVSATASDMYIGSGLIDTNTTQGYVLTPLVKNYSTSSTGGTGSGSTDDRRHIAFVTGVNVDLSFADSTLQSRYAANGVTHFQVPYSAEINADSTTSMTFEIVPYSLISQLGANELQSATDRVLILANIQLVGTINNGDFTSQSFRYPVQVCKGCLTNDLGACSGISHSFVPTHLGGNCNVFQDTSVDCCTGANSALVCPAVGTGM